MRAVERVRRVHEHVRGVAGDGRPYSADDPELLAFVHATEVDSFLAAYQRYGAGLTPDDADRYVGEMAVVAARARRRSRSRRRSPSCVRCSPRRRCTRRARRATRSGS